VFFCTQLPTDIPNDVLSQLGARIQHALRAFTPTTRSAGPDREDVPDNAELQARRGADLLGIGEAIVTVLSERARRPGGRGAGCARPGR